MEPIHCDILKVIDPDGETSPICTLDDQKLVREGWMRRFIADARMAAESETAYYDLGYEVLLAPFDAKKMSEKCDACEMVLKKYLVVYTRKRPT